MWFAVPETKAGFEQSFDEYGDSYTEPIDKEQLKNLLDKITPRVRRNFTGLLFQINLAFGTIILLCRFGMF